MYGKKTDKNAKAHEKKSERKSESAYTPISEETFQKTILDNFNSYCTDKDERIKVKEEMEEDDTEVHEEAPEWNETEAIRNLSRLNGKKTDEVIYSLLSQVFDEQSDKVESYLMSYTDKLLKEKVLQKPAEINRGLSKFIQNLGELALDNPMIVESSYNVFIKPMWQKKLVDFKYVKWIPPESSPGGDSEDDDFNPAD